MPVVRSDKDHKGEQSALFIPSPHVDTQRVRYRNDSGHVTIEGTVKSFFEKQMAQEALRNVDWVDSIANHLTVSD